MKPIIVIGAGPAGLSAALQLVRAEIPVKLIAKSLAGTYLNANLIENLVCFPRGITGQDLQQNIRELIQYHKIPVIYDDISSIRQNSSGFELTGQKAQYSSEILIIASGTIPNAIGIPGEAAAAETGRIFYEMPPSPPENSKICIIGSGDAAYDYALNLQKRGNYIDILQRSPHHRCLPILFKRAMQNSEIQIKFPYEVIACNPVGGGISLSFQSESEKENVYDYAFVAVGRHPNIAFLSHDLASAFTKRHPVPNLYFIGDVINGQHRQIAIAMGDGIKLGMTLTKQLQPTNSPQ